MADVGRPEGSNKVPDHITAIVDGMSFDRLVELSEVLQNIGVLTVEPDVEILVGNLLLCELIMGEENAAVFQEWLGLCEGKVDEDFDMAVVFEKLGALDAVVTDRKSQYASADEIGHAGYLRGFRLIGIDTGRPGEPVGFDRGALDSFFETLRTGVPPEYPSIKVSDFPEAKEGDVVAEGMVYFTIMGTRPGLGCDCEYLRTDDGTEYFDNDLFRGFCEKRVRLIRTSDGFKVEEVK